MKRACGVVYEHVKLDIWQGIVVGAARGPRSLLTLEPVAVVLS